MKTFTLRRSLWVPKPLEEVFSLLHPGNMEEGVRIKHRLKVFGIPITWVSEITAWDPPYGFVDEQKKGPYRLWRHEHRFREERDGTVCEDEVKYAVPGGALINRLLVAPDLKKIFDYRQDKLKRLLTRA
jgi:ligand-binding SRPBCC domain-containing protein